MSWEAIGKRSREQVFMLILFSMLTAARASNLNYGVLLSLHKPVRNGTACSISASPPISLTAQSYQ
jgi:hypothetical protein